MNPPAASAPWWGSFTIPHGHAGRFCIGVLEVTVSRNAHEWQVVRERIAGADDEQVRVEVPVPRIALAPSARVTRYATMARTEKIRLVPVLPDRTVVTRPENPITLLPRSEVTLYVGSPVWIRLVEGETEVLGDLPVLPPKETWTGRNLREGELCYATTTYGRLDLDEAALRPHRVMTTVVVRNEAYAPFVFERVSLPVRRLSVFASAEGRLWTEGVTLERSSDTTFAQVRIAEGPPRVVPNAERLSEPRDPPEAAGVFHAFGAFFG